MFSVLLLHSEVTRRDSLLLKFSLQFRRRDSRRVISEDEALLQIHSFI